MDALLPVLPVVISPGLRNSLGTAKQPENGCTIVRQLHKAVLLTMEPLEHRLPRVLNDVATWNVTTSQLVIKNIIFP